MGLGPLLWAMTVNVTLLPTAGVALVTVLVMPMSAAVATMLRGARTVLLGKYVQVSRPLVSPKLPVGSQGTFAFPPEAAPNAR